jgi:hypothetical protein
MCRRLSTIPAKKFCVFAAFFRRRNRNHTLRNERILQKFRNVLYTREMETDKNRVPLIKSFWVRFFDAS